jgi:DNA polymerase III delta subunit
MAVIQELPLSRLKKSLALLSDIDTALKQGKADPEVSLDLFVWKF